MSRKVPHCSECVYLLDKSFGEYCRRRCSHPEYQNPIYKNSRTGFVKSIPSPCAVTSPRWCPLRGGARQ